MKKRIGNDITFTWRIFRKDGEARTAEDFEGKDVVVELISPLQRPVEIEDVSISTGVVTFTFKGKAQKVLGSYTAVLSENRGEDGMVTIDTVEAVTLVKHSFMEEDGDEGDVIEATSVEIESEITAGGSGGGVAQVQADWAQTDDAQVDYIKNKPDLDEYAKARENIVPEGATTRYQAYRSFSSDTFVQIYNNTLEDRRLSLQSARQLKLEKNTSENGGKIYIGEPGSEVSDWYNIFDIYHSRKGLAVWERTAVEQIPTATAQSAGLMSAADKAKVDNMSGGGSAADVTYDNTISGLSATNVQDAIDEMADTKLYETVVLTVGSADSTFSPVGQTVTVTLEDGSATQYTVPYSRQISFIVQRGMRYTISGTSTEDYRVLPISVKAAIPTRYLTMRYIPIATGVFILQRDGNYYLRQEYDAETMADDAVGVLILTSALINAGFGIVIGKDDQYVEKTYNGTNYNSNNNMKSTTALVGYSNTALLVSDSDQGAIWVYGMSLQLHNTSSGYLPSLAEAVILRSNTEEINRCISIINGILIRTDHLYRTSTYIYDNYVSRMYYASGTPNRDSSTFRTRPIYQFLLT